MALFKVNSTNAFEAVRSCDFCPTYWRVSELTICYNCGEIFCPKCIPHPREKLVCVISPDCKSGGLSVAHEQREYNRYCSETCFMECKFIALRR